MHLQSTISQHLYRGQKVARILAHNTPTHISQQLYWNWSVVFRPTIVACKAIVKNIWQLILYLVMYYVTINAEITIGQFFGVLVINWTLPKQFYAIDEFYILKVYLKASVTKPLYFRENIFVKEINASINNWLSYCLTILTVCATDIFAFEITWRGYLVGHVANWESLTKGSR